VRKEHAQRLSARRGRAQTLAVRERYARRLGAPRRTARQLDAERGLAPLPAVLRGRARRLSELAQRLAVREMPAQALAALCFDAPPLRAHVKALAESGAIATFDQSSNASWLVAQASHATALVVRSYCAMSRVPLMMLPANATPTGLPARGPPSLHETAPGTARRPESNFLPAAT
jgi:hypothetical protein